MGLMNQAREQVFNLVVPARAEYLSVIRVLAGAAARELGFSDDSVADLKVALSEASTNVVRHAYPRNLDDSERVIEIFCYAEDDTLFVEVLDRGRGMPLPPPASEGLGLGIMGSLMDKVDVETGSSGTTVIMAKSRQSSRGL